VTILFIRILLNRTLGDSDGVDSKSIPAEVKADVTSKPGLPVGAAGLRPRPLLREGERRSRRGEIAESGDMLYHGPTARARGEPLSTLKADTIRASTTRQTE